MVTNINLASPESEKKIVFSGKVSLILSLTLLFLAIGIYAAVSFISSRYKSENIKIETQIRTENAKISGPEYAEMADFQEKLNLIEKVLEDHVYFESCLKNFSKYVLPEVRLSKFDWKSGGNQVAVSGIAPNFDVLSRELILLKNSPLVQSVEFKSATESLNSQGQSGINFELSANIKKEALNK